MLLILKNGGWPARWAEVEIGRVRISMIRDRINFFISLVDYTLVGKLFVHGSQLFAIKLCSWDFGRCSTN
jgi:hypothetical protein